jgi:hypothetical protein
MRNKRVRWRRIFVWPPGAETGAYQEYVTLSATQQTGKKTSKVARLFRIEP